MKHVTILKTSLGAVTAAHTIRDSTWKLCIIWLFPIPMWPEWLKAGGTGILWSLGSPEAAHHSERPIKFLLPVTVSKERPVFPLPCPQKDLRVLAGSVVSISQRELLLPISETAHRSMKGGTSASKESMTSRWWFCFDIAYPLPRLQIKQWNLICIPQRAGERLGIQELSQAHA